MNILLTIPDEIATHVFPDDRDAARVAVEALAIEGYRARRLSESQVRRLLGYETRMEVHALLKQHNVYLDYDLDALEQDIQTSDQMQRERLEAVLKRAG